MLLARLLKPRGLHEVATTFVLVQSVEALNFLLTKREVLDDARYGDTKFDRDRDFVTFLEP